LNGLIFLATVVLLGIIAWVLVEKFAPNKLAGLKTWVLNVLASIPMFGPDLASLLMHHNFEQWIAVDKLPYYFGAVILLNLFARFRTSTPIAGRGDDARGVR
jgi:hypothetical protein